ncbi:DUF2690 domain-containing protein [Streptomyces sp. NPDC047725]|uniref:helix-turn-helix domain-containing protein n=1 Tax=Streptomyces sp. NPDC047725 TaxID=3365487 RepID=UPI00371B4189
MPRWKALPEELDPQIKEFAGQLRRLVDRSELSIASLADATGYSKTSWERYLNGRLLAPKGAIVALAEVTGTNPMHLTTLWELAERAWSRSEMRHDMTMEAIRISQARAALGEPGRPSEDPGGGRGRSGWPGGGATAGPGGAGPAGVAPTLPPTTVPAQPTAADSPDSAAGPVRGRSVPGGPSYPSPGGPFDGNSWGMAGYRGPAPTGDRGPRDGAALAAGGPATAPVPGSHAGPGAYGGPQRAGSGGRGSSPGGGRRTGSFVVGVIGVLVVIAAAFYVIDQGEAKKNEDAKPSSSPTASAGPVLPPGVKCSGETCTGKDPETMGCGGDLVTTTATATVGTAGVEVRYSKICGAAWARVTQAGQGDEVRIGVGGGSEQSGKVAGPGDTAAYTPMVAVENGTDATACVTLAAGGEGCTE